jgi:hypothetical protein
LLDEFFKPAFRLDATAGHGRTAVKFLPRFLGESRLQLLPIQHVQ